MQRRKLGGARVEASDRAVLRSPNPEGCLDAEGGEHAELNAWTLNVSRGGLRLIVEERIVEGAQYLVSIGEAEQRLARVVWIREENDGQIVGMQFVEAAGDSKQVSSAADESDSGV